MTREQQLATEARIAAASKLLGKVTARIAREDPELGERLYRVLAAEMQAVREGR